MAATHKIVNASTVLDLIGNTHLVELNNMELKPGVRVFAKLEGQNPTGSLKDRIAKYMIDRAEREGLLTPEKRILEPTSGNTGILPGPSWPASRDTRSP